MQRVLIVDDERFNINVLVELLRDEHKLMVAKDGERALAAARSENKPDLILLDVVMPGLDGFQVCQRLKADPATIDIPVIFITGRDSVDFEAKGLEMGAVDYISKPFHRSVVLARVRAHLGLRRKTEIIERMASLDGLTEIANRRGFDNTLELEWRRGSRERAPLSLIMIDIDMFKQYNDHYGHGAGDTCLKQVAQALAGAVNRPGDFVARYGGEEFAAILPATDLDGAARMAETFRRAVANLKIPHAASEVAEHVTISLGAATSLPASAGSIEAFKARADEMLYAAKRAGRNRVSAS